MQPAFILRGHPSYVWRRGQERRLDLLRRYVPLENRAILDIGCGVGTWVRQFRNFSDRVFGIDIEAERVSEGGQDLPGLALAESEYLPFEDEAFDVVFLHEVIEHVADDRKTIREAVRCTRPGGCIVIYAPNRLYPFETHGFYLGDRFVFRLLPLINYMPNVIRNHFCHHVRIYRQRDIHALFDGLDVDFVVSTHIYPGLDNVATRRPVLGRVLHRLVEIAERTPLRVFGISHFVVAQKRESPQRPPVLRAAGELPFTRN